MKRTDSTPTPASKSKVTRRGAIKAAAAASIVGLSKKSEAAGIRHGKAQSEGPRRKSCVSQLKVIAQNDYERSLVQYC